MGFWAKFAIALASVGKGALKGALWASQHPDVVQEVLTIAQVAQKSATAAK